MNEQKEIEFEADRILRLFSNSGAKIVQPAILQQADTLLDLYGEDIRARAYVTSDPFNGEMMLRPDFTVPIVKKHMNDLMGDETARYAYCGKVFRRQERNSDRASEYLQVGYEIFDRADVVKSDTDAFCIIKKALGDLPLRIVTGDIGILMAAVSGLKTTDRRKKALLRHIWRPKRFITTLENFTTDLSLSTERFDGFDEETSFGKHAKEIGLRSKSEITKRIENLLQDGKAAPISTKERGVINSLLNIGDKCPQALIQLKALLPDMPALKIAIEKFERRLAALDKANVDLSVIDFEISYGRTSMEYYDGFVFGFYSENNINLPPIATGGRYDALTKHIGKGREIPAVGGVVRPDLILQSKGFEDND